MIPYRIEACDFHGRRIRGKIEFREIEIIEVRIPTYRRLYTGPQAWHFLFLDFDVVPLTSWILY